MRELFVYYRIRTGDEAIALQIVGAFQAVLRLRFPCLQTRLLRRSEPLRTETWMETYAVDPGAGVDGVSADIQRAIESAAQALAPHIDGLRHTEWFVDSAQARRPT